MAFLLDLEVMATEFARTYKREKAASRERGASEIDCASAIVARALAWIGNEYLLVIRSRVPKSLGDRPRPVTIEDH